MKKAFTMIELVFVIVILGILVMVAIPKMSGVTTDAQIAKGQADVATIRAAIVNERQTRLIRGKTEWIEKLSKDSSKLFTGDGTRTLLQYGITEGTGAGEWERLSTPSTGYADSYRYRVGSSINLFDYNSSSGTFSCSSGNECSELN